MPKGFLLKNNLTKDTLLKLAVMGMITIAAASSPYFLHTIARGYFKEKHKDQEAKRARKIRELQKRKLIEFKELNDGTIRIILSHLGKKLIRQYKLEDIKIKTPKKWDELWRIIIYDIPSKQKKACDAFRKKIRCLGLYPIQKSVWVSPYDCLAELEFVCNIFNIDIDNHLFYFKTSEIPKEKELKDFFNLN